ncbi:MAG: VanZ family protein [Gallionella sp.]|nr:VanZ family protein [Gallionella sp.]
MASDSRIVRLSCLAAALFIVIGLFWAGSKPVAVGLFTGNLDKVAHFATFALIAALLWLSFQRGRPLLVIAIVSAIGAADELHQYYLPGRSASIVDLAVDIFAVVAVVFLLKYARRYNE